MRASVLTALLLSFCPTISVTSSGLSSKWLMSDWHSPRMALPLTGDTCHFQGHNASSATDTGHREAKAKRGATSDEAEC